MSLPRAAPDTLPDEQTLDLVAWARLVSRGWLPGLLVFGLVLGVGLALRPERQVTYRYEATYLVSFAEARVMDQPAELPLIVTELARLASSDEVLQPVAARLGSRYTADALRQRTAATVVPGPNRRILLYVLGPDEAETSRVAAALDTGYRELAPVSVSDAWRSFGPSLTVVDPMSRKYRLIAGPRNLDSLAPVSAAVLAGVATAWGIATLRRRKVEGDPAS